MRPAIIISSLFCVEILIFGSPAGAIITYLGSATIPASTTDDSGLLMLLEDGLPGNRAGGMGSAIAYSGVGNHYYMMPDRGPGDGSVSYVSRMYDMQITVAPSGPGYSITPVLGHTTLFNNQLGAYFTGNASAFDSTNSPASMRFDPEGMRVSHSGKSVFLSDEFGPFVYEFDLGSATRMRSIPVPAKFLIAHPNANNNLELPPGNTTGRQANRSMEGLAITPDGSKLYGIMQSPLLQDGALDGSNNRVGVNCRFLEMDLATGNTREFMYPLSNASIGATEVLAINSQDFLILERDGRGLNSGNTAQFKKIFRISIATATDISGVPNLPASGTPLGITPVTKVLFLDVLAATGISGSHFPEKLEGIAFGPDLPDGRHLLLVTADNDFKSTIDNWFFAFAIDPADLPGFVPQDIAPVTDVAAPDVRSRPSLAMPVPHPVRGTTRFDYALPRDEHVWLAIYDARGRRIRLLVDALERAGARSAPWDRRDDAGDSVPAGTYFARLETAGAPCIRKIVVVE